MFEYDDNQLNQQSYSRFVLGDTREVAFLAMLLSNLSHLGKLRLFTECLNTMTTNSLNNIIRGFFKRIQERLVGAEGPPFVQPLMFRKTKTLHRTFEHDDSCVHLGMFREVFFSAMLFHPTSHI
jgi:hypothetical protein